jgi:molybdate transport system ATP-binding protein
MTAGPSWLHLRATIAERGFAVDLDLAPGERLAVLGPNGAGKSTLVSLLAGTLVPDSGRAELGGRVLFDLDGGQRRWLPPHARGIGLLAQDPLLFPHLSVLDNVAFGPRARGVRGAAARQLAERWLTEVGATDLIDRRPSRVSGGQAQRVAIARALAVDPTLLLLDEPLAALDVAVAPMLRRVLATVLAGRSALIVTHDLLDALLLSTWVVVLDHGKVVETGPTDEVLQRPRTRFTANIAGLNLMRGTIAGQGLRTPSGLTLQGLAHGDPSQGAAAVATFPPSAVAIYLDSPNGSPRNLIPVTIAEIEPRGELVRVRADDHHGHTVAADLTPAAVADLDLYPGRRVLYSLKAVAVAIYPAPEHTPRSPQPSRSQG